MAEPLLTVSNLRVAYPAPSGWNEVLRGVSFTLGRERLGIVGESGSGKSTAGRAIMRLLPPQARATADALRFAGVDLLTAPERQMRNLRGGRIAMILQDPRYSLNPLHKVERQIVESCRLHARMSRAEARERALDLLEQVRIRDPQRVLGLYPHELSGGMGQRVMIAMMLAAEPDIVIADEPTSALDVTVRGQILDILDERVSAKGLGLIFISHDLPLVADFCDRVLVMYAGRVLEALPASELPKARHPYTRALLGSLPPLDRKVERLVVPERDPSWLEGPAA
ncbi:ABC transporter ATP-binding protein [Rubrimonas sp.]|uniref:ABC transporter ATP-binding protein n=1 Tax=Rubrimonas sp. TaxID=2036015 RepID=UPI002FDCD664